MAELCCKRGEDQVGHLVGAPSLKMVYNAKNKVDGYAKQQ